MIIRRMCSQFSIPTEIIPAETIRESDGLAMSSRNRYLNADERQEAVWLSKTLHQVADRIRQGQASARITVDDVVEIESAAKQILNHRGWSTDYISVRRRSDLKAPQAQDLAESNQLVVLAASRCGATRLIDNLEI
jgi:pantoate--beta-alanine ligase